MHLFLHGGGLAGAAAAFGASDIRLKENIVKIGETPHGTNTYSWTWTNEALPIVGDQPTEGMLAQEVQMTQPDAVVMGADGFLRVDYSRVV